MKSWLTIALVLGGAAIATPAMACSQVSRIQAREMQVSWDRFLERARVVRGTYSQVSPADINGEIPEEELGEIRGRNGRVVVPTIRYNANVIYCPSMAEYPLNGDQGRFYVRRSADDRWELVHFEPARSR